MMTAGLIDRAIDLCQVAYGRSTVKNTVAALVLVLDEAVRDGLLSRNPAKDRARRRFVGRSTLPATVPESPRDFRAAKRRHAQSVGSGSRASGWLSGLGRLRGDPGGDGSADQRVSGLQVGDVDLRRGLLIVRRQTYSGRGGLVTKETRGRRRRSIPIIDPLRPTLERLMAGRPADAQLLLGPRGGVITTATLRDATRWDDLVVDLGLAGLVRHGLRHTALTWMADAGIELHLLQRVAGHQDPAVTSRYLHPDHQAVLEWGRRTRAGGPNLGPTLRRPRSCRTGRWRDD